MDRLRRLLPYAVLLALAAVVFAVSYHAVTNGALGECSGYACAPGWTGAYLPGGDAADDEVRCGTTTYHGTMVGRDLRFTLPPGGCALLGPDPAGSCGSTDLYNFTVVDARHIDLSTVVNQSHVGFSNMYCGLSG